MFFLPSEFESDSPNIASWWHLLVFWSDCSFLPLFLSNRKSYSHKMLFCQARPGPEKPNYHNCGQLCCHLMTLMLQKFHQNQLASLLPWSFSYNWSLSWLSYCLWDNQLMLEQRLHIYCCCQMSTWNTSTISALSPNIPCKLSIHWNNSKIVLQAS